MKLALHLEVWMLSQKDESPQVMFSEAKELAHQCTGDQNSNMFL